MSTSPLPPVNKADLDSTLARVSSKPNVAGALILTKETGAIIRSTLADDALAKKYSLGVKRTLCAGIELMVGLLQSSKEVTKDIDEDVKTLVDEADGRTIYGCYGCGLRNMNC